jgi:hypothetical protein
LTNCVQKVQEEKEKEEDRMFDAKQEAMTDDILEVHKSIDLILKLLKLGAPPEEIQKNRNLIVIGTFNVYIWIHGVRPNLKLFSAMLQV